MCIIQGGGMKHSLMLSDLISKNESASKLLIKNIAKVNKIH